MPYAVNRGVHIWYREVGGEGLPLILVQGLSFSSDYWLEAPTRLMPYFRVFVVDNRGVGRSDKPSEIWSMADMGRDILAVADAAGLERFAVAGISLGGMIAQEVALQVHPERLAGLLLMVTTPGILTGKFSPFDSLLRLARLVRRTPENLRRVREILVSKKTMAHGGNEIFQAYDQLIREDPVLPSMFLRQLIAATFHHASSARLGKIQAPVLVAAGAEDRLILPQNSEILAGLIPNAQLKIFPDTGHVFPLEDPEAFRTTIATFLEMLEKAGHTTAGVADKVHLEPLPEAETQAA